MSTTVTVSVRVPYDLRLMLEDQDVSISCGLRAAVLAVALTSPSPERGEAPPPALIQTTAVLDGRTHQLFQHLILSRGLTTLTAVAEEVLRDPAASDMLLEVLRLSLVSREGVLRGMLSALGVVPSPDPHSARRVSALSELIRRTRFMVEADTLSLLERDLASTRSLMEGDLAPLRAFLRKE